jgi:NADPH:quinone reductase-like Zn-dependent oxidoreductase
LTDRLGANLDGALAEYAVFNEEAVVLPPTHLSFEEAATLPCAAVTAWVPPLYVSKWRMVKNLSQRLQLGKNLSIKLLKRTL